MEHRRRAAAVHVVGVVVLQDKQGRRLLSALSTAVTRVGLGVAARYGCVAAAATGRRAHGMRYGRCPFGEAADFQLLVIELVAQLPLEAFRWGQQGWWAGASKEWTTQRGKRRRLDARHVANLSDAFTLLSYFPRRFLLDLQQRGLAGRGLLLLLFALVEQPITFLQPSEKVGGRQRANESGEGEEGGKGEG